MVLDDLDIKRVCILETGTQAPLLVDADAPLSDAIAFQRIQSIRWRKPQILDHAGRMRPVHLHQCAKLHIGGETPACSGGEQPPGVLVGEAPDQLGAPSAPARNTVSMNTVFSPGKFVEMRQ